jgi:nitrogen fixation protein
MVAVSNQTIRRVGKAILGYDGLPAADAFHQSQAKNRWLFGGNRSGKSEANIGYDLCSFALGVHPWRKTPKEATIWAAANTWPLVGKLLWSEKIRTYLPLNQIEPPIIWHNKQDEIPAEIRLKNGNHIEFKAYEQGRKAFEGRAIDGFYGDEQCKSDNFGIWTEIQARLMDKNGFSAQSMTPIIPQAWLEERIQEMPETDEVFYANLNDNRRSRGGYIPDREIDELIAQWPAEVQETRIKGRFAAFFGAVYKTFNRQVHIIKPFKIPDDWLRYRAIDWGFNNPFACIWMARDPDRRWYVYAEHYQPRETLAYHAERIKQISGREKYQATWADHDAQDCHEFRGLGISTLSAKKDVHLGIEAVQAALKVQADGKPRLFIFNTCKNTGREMPTYKWAEATENKEAKDEPLKVGDHTLDCIRYIIYAVEGKHYFSESELAR